MKDVSRVVDHYLPIRTNEELSVSLLTKVSALCDRVEDDADDAVVVLHLIGADDPDGLGPWPGSVAIHLVNKWERALRRLERLEAVTITVTEGVCAGPALNVLLSSDYRIAAGGTVLSLASEPADPWPGMAVHRLAHQIGVARARQLVLFGSRLTAPRALEIGLLDEVTELPGAAALAMARRAGELPGKEVAIRRRLLLDAMTSSFEDSLGVHLAACDRALRSRSDQQPAQTR
jgi:isomerase DpgB